VRAYSHHEILSSSKANFGFRREIKTKKGRGAVNSFNTASHDYAERRRSTKLHYSTSFILPGFFIIPLRGGKKISDFCACRRRVYPFFHSASFKNVYVGAASERSSAGDPESSISIQNTNFFLFWYAYADIKIRQWRQRNFN
jgi:hypothetical protein